jgi:hypothetical protein
MLTIGQMKAKSHVDEEPVMISLPSMSIFLAFFIIAVLCSQFEKEVVNIKSPISSVAAAVESERPYCTLVAPAPQGVGVDVKNAGYFFNRQERRYFMELTVSYHYFTPTYLKAYLVERCPVLYSVLNPEAIL